MSIAPALLTASGSDTDAQDYTTASVSPTPGTTVLAGIHVYDAGGNRNASSTASGCGLTWNLVNGAAGGATEPSLRVYRAYADPATVTAGAITFDDVVTAGQTADGAQWVVIEVAGVNPTANNGVVQSATAAVATDTITATLAAFGDAANGTIGFVGAYDTAGGVLNITEGSGFTMLAGSENSQAAGGDTLRMGVEWLATNDTSVDATVSAANDRMVMVAMELKAAALNTGTATGASSADGTAVGTVTPGTGDHPGTAAGAATATGTAAATVEHPATAAGAASASGTALGTTLPVPGAMAWFDASDTATITDAGSGKVSAWADKSPNGYTLTQGTDANRPVTGTRTINGLNVLDFDGAGDVLVNANVPLDVTTTTFVVLETDTLPGAASAFVLIATSAANVPVFLDAATDKPATSAGTPLLGPNALTISTPVVITAKQNGASSVVYEDGAPGTTGDVGSGTATGVDVGGLVAGGAAFSFNGTIGEIISYPTALSDADRELVEDYLTAKWLGGAEEITGTATGAATATGTGAASVNRSAVAAGASTSSGAASAVRKVLATAAAAAVAVGVSAGLVTHPASGSGASTATSSSAATVSHSATAAGSSTSAGTAAGIVTAQQIAGTATGAASSTGTANAFVSHPALATGGATSGGTSSATPAHHAVAVGAGTSTGNAAGSVSTLQSATASGSAVSSGIARATIGVLPGPIRTTDRTTLLVADFSTLLTTNKDAPVFTTDLETVVTTDREPRVLTTNRS